MSRLLAVVEEGGACRRATRRVPIERDDADIAVADDTSRLQASWQIKRHNQAQLFLAVALLCARSAHHSVSPSI